MNITVLGAAGFIGKNLVKQIAFNNKIKLVDRELRYFDTIKKFGIDASYYVSDFTLEADYDSLVMNSDIVYHLVSTTVPTTSNQNIPEELISNVVVSSKILEACVRNKVKKVIFISSGGTVYGKDVESPIKEESAMNPISSYGIQKLTIEKLLYLYNYLYGLDYRVIRLANPYGPYQRPNGVLGVVTTFAYKAMKDEEITIFGDGSVVRDYIYIDDAIRGILNIVNSTSTYKTFNLGQGKGTSVNEVICTLEEITCKKLKTNYVAARQVDVPVNYLDIGRYEKVCGKLNPISLKEGIKKTLEFMEEYYE